MSDTLIKGMEMPTEGTIIAIYKIDGKLYATRGLSGKLYPIVPVPPHGRLGGLDELKAKIEKEDNGYSWDSYGNGMYDAFQSVYQCIDAAPTIIPAEEGEK